MHADDRLIETVIGCAIDIHRALGPGLLESAYQRILRDELDLLGLPVECERSVPVTYRTRVYEHSFRADLVVAGRLVVELKCTEKAADIHKAQLLTYLRCLELRHGLLLNFGMARAIDGVFRITNYRAAE